MKSTKYPLNCMKILEIIEIVFKLQSHSFEKKMAFDPMERQITFSLGKNRQLF